MGQRFSPLLSKGFTVGITVELMLLISGVGCKFGIGGIDWDCRMSVSGLGVGVRVGVSAGVRVGLGVGVNVGLGG